MALPSGIHAQQDFFERVQAVLDNHVSDDGQVNYSGIAERPELVDEAVYDIAHTNLSGRSLEYTAAFYINAYNTLVIKQVADEWPIESPLDVKGFFDETRFEVAGELLTLNEIENDKLRKEDGDPRIHFALVCAGSGCPPLSKSAPLPGSLRTTLDDLTKLALNTERMVSVDHQEKTVKISKIFEWYAADFGSNTKEVLDYINQYRPESLPSNYHFSYLEYDWSVNGN